MARASHTSAWCAAHAATTKAGISGSACVGVGPTVVAHAAQEPAASTCGPTVDAGLRHGWLRRRMGLGAGVGVGRRGGATRRPRGHGGAATLSTVGGARGGGSGGPQWRSGASWRRWWSPATARTPVEVAAGEGEEEKQDREGD